MCCGSWAGRRSAVFLVHLVLVVAAMEWLPQLYASPAPVAKIELYVLVVVTAFAISIIAGRIPGLRRVFWGRTPQSRGAVDAPLPDALEHPRSLELRDAAESVIGRERERERVAAGVSLDTGRAAAGNEDVVVARRPTGAVQSTRHWPCRLHALSSAPDAMTACSTRAGEVNSLPCTVFALRRPLRAGNHSAVASIGQ